MAVDISSNIDTISNIHTKCNGGRNNNNIEEMRLNSEIYNNKWREDNKT